MAHTVVKFTKNDDGEKDDGLWHYAFHLTGNQKLCTGEFYGIGESSAIFKTKGVEKGGINCPKCLRIINEMKSIKL